MPSKLKHQNGLDPQQLESKLFNLKKHKKSKKARPHCIDTHSEPRSRGSPTTDYTCQLDDRDIFERSVQEQATMSSLSRRSSFNDQSINSTSPNLGMSPVNIPTHLSSEAFIPTCLDATTEILTDDNANLEKVEVIQSNTPYITDVLNQTYNTSKSKRSSPLLKRRHTFNNLTIFPTYDSDITMETLARSNTNSLSNYYVDYSDSKKLNFCSFADLLTDELLQKCDQNDLSSIDGVMSRPKTPSLDFTPSSPISRRNSRIYVAPAMIQTNAR